MTMQSLKLPLVTIEARGEKIVIRHNTKGMETEISQSKMERWAMSLLRKELDFPKVAK